MNQTGVNVFPNHVTGDSQEQLFPRKVKEASSLNYPSGKLLAKTYRWVLGFVRWGGSIDVNMDVLIEECVFVCENQLWIWILGSGDMIMSLIMVPLPERNVFLVISLMFAVHLPAPFSLNSPAKETWPLGRHVHAWERFLSQHFSLSISSLCFFVCYFICWWDIISFIYKEQCYKLFGDWLRCVPIAWHNWLQCALFFNNAPFKTDQLIHSHRSITERRKRRQLLKAYRYCKPMSSLLFWSAALW